MASVTKSAILDATPAAVWDVIADFGAVHSRFAPGFVTDTRIVEPGVRLVTFADGASVRERLIGKDPERRRMAYAIEGRFAHHSAAFEALPAEGGRTRLVWTADVLPEEAGAVLDQRMGDGMTAIVRTLSGAPAL